MRVRALTDFGGQYAMIKDAEADIPEGPVADTLIAGGYIVAIASEEPELEESELFGKNEQLAEEEPEPVADVAVQTKQAEAAPVISLQQMTKTELISYAEENDIDIDVKLRKSDIIEQIEEAQEEGEEE